QSTGLVEISSTLSDGTARGTGIIWTSDGTVVTNHHVVAGATAIKVTDVATGQSYTATYVGGDATADVAVLRLEGASGLTPAALAPTAAGADDAVTAVGDAGGDGGTLTASPGTVTALGQHITVREDDGSAASLSGLIEVHAYVVPGDSGGAVLNSDGEVVGMNVAASAGSREVSGYAIPIAEVSSVVQQILSGPESSTIDLGYNGYLGVGLDPRSQAPLVARTTTRSGAATAGIGAGDTITSVDGHAVATVTELRALLARTSPGDRVEVGWTDAGGAAHTAEVTLVDGPVA
ncbi:MAG: S1C family serine protease, partial [Marmoricola sp.]